MAGQPEHMHICQLAEAGGQPELDLAPAGGGAWRAGGRIGLSLRVAVFHRHFLVSLPEIFVSLHDTYKELTSRMGIETMKQQVTKVLHIWQAWSLFPLSYVARLERTLLYGSPDADAADKAEARAHATITQSQPQP
jgi:hypothetical protein